MQTSNNGLVLDRRTWVVLSSLLIGMTAISSLLLVLEPGPVAPLPEVTLLSTDQSIDPADRLFNIPRNQDWQAIIVHDSGTDDGSAESVGAAHERLGRDGLGYHFVINNGSGERDGTIEIGFRWQQQISGTYLDGPGADWFNSHAIGICLIGDADTGRFSDSQLRELIWLVRRLQDRFGIPREAVYAQIGSDSHRVSPHFPDAWFRSTLLNH